MIGILSFLSLVVAVAFVAAVVLLVVRSVKRQPRKPFIILAVVSAVAFLGLCVWISDIYVPAEKPQDVVAEAEPPSVLEPEKSTETEPPSVPEQEASAESLDSTVENVDNGVDKSTNAPVESSANLVPEHSDAPAEAVANPLLNAPFQIGDVMNGVKTEKIGEYGYVVVSKSDFPELDGQQIMEFARARVENSGYNWVSVVFDDGTGICFTGGHLLAPLYGEMDAEGTVTQVIKYLVFAEDGYSFADPE